MEIKVGGKYNQRGGGVVEIVNELGGEWPWRGDNDLSYDNQGLFMADKTTSQYDLISEYVEPTPKPTPTEYQRGINDAVKWFNARNPHLLMNITTELIEKELSE